MKKTKVLHIVNTLEAGGIEKLVADFSKHYSKNIIDLKILCVKNRIGIHLPLILKSNVDVAFLCNYKKYPIKFFKLYNEYLHMNEIDIIHSHLNFTSWIFINNFTIAKNSYRIAHFHNTFLKPKKKYLALFRKINLFLTNFYSDKNIGISKICLNSIFGKNWDNNKKNILVYNGVNFDDYTCPSEKHTNRVEYIIGHIGRLRYQKNHDFIINIASKIVKYNHNIHFVFVGSGELYDILINDIRNRNLEENIHLVGERSDVNNLLCQFDLFILPSRFEGFGLSFLEAQISGIPCLVSENITTEIPLISPSKKINLSNPDEWINTCLEFSKSNNKPKKQDHKKILKKFEIKNWVNSLEKIYREKP